MFDGMPGRAGYGLSRGICFLEQLVFVYDGQTVGGYPPLRVYRLWSTVYGLAYRRGGLALVFFYIVLFRIRICCIWGFVCFDLA